MLKIAYQKACMSYKFKNYSSFDDLKPQEILKLDRLLKEVRANTYTHRCKSYFRHIFQTPISFYQVRKLFHIAEQLNCVKIYSFYNQETGKNFWHCEFIQDIPYDFLIGLNFSDDVNIAQSKKNIKIELLKQEIKINSHQSLKALAKKIKVCYASAKQYYKYIKKNYPELKLIPKPKKPPRNLKQELFILQEENKKLREENSFLGQMYHQYQWFQKGAGIIYDPANDNWIREIKNLIYIGKNHEELTKQLISERDYYKNLSVNKLPYEALNAFDTYQDNPDNTDIGNACKKILYQNHYQNRP